MAAAICSTQQNISKRQNSANEAICFSYVRPEMIDLKLAKWQTLKYSVLPLPLAVIYTLSHKELFPKLTDK